MKSSLADFGFAVCGIDLPEEATKELATREWPGEHGEDVYTSPDGQKLQACDIEVQLCHKAKIAVTANLLKGIGLGKNGWRVAEMLNAASEDKSAEVPLWNLKNSVMAPGYEGVAATTGGIAVRGILLFESAGWPLSAGKVYTLSFGMAVGADTDHVDVYLGKSHNWADMATNFKRIYPRAGRSRYALQFTVSDDPDTGDSLCVVFNINNADGDTGMEDYPANTGIELYDLKLEEGANDSPEWTPYAEDVEAGNFPEWRDANTALRLLRDYLIGAGGLVKLYCPYLRKGWGGAYLKKFHDIEVARSGIDEIVSVNVSFRVTDPKTEVKLIYVGD